MLEQELTQLGATVDMLYFSPAANGSKVGLDDYLVGNGREALEKLIAEAKPCLYWETCLIAGLPEYQRTDALTALFSKIVRLEAIDRLPWRTLCHDKLKMKVSDFNALVKDAEAKLARRMLESKIRLDEYIKARASYCHISRPSFLERDRSGRCQTHLREE